MFFEFIVAGTPLSHQTQNRAGLQLWKEAVRAAATRSWPAGQAAFAGRLQIMVDYYHDGPVTFLDGDNLLKPVQDALNGLVYGDDRQIVDARVRKASLNGNILLGETSLLLAEGFGLNASFLHIQVADAPEHRELFLLR